MLSNYIKIALRNFLRSKGYSFINIAGLAFGIASALFIGIYIWDELRYDDFHTNENLYRVALHRKFPNNESTYATVPAPMAETLVETCPEVKDATRMLALGGDIRIRIEDKIFYEQNVLAADSNFFKIFSFDLIKGNMETVLEERNSVALSSSTARRFFGDSDPVGKQIYVFDDTTLYMVTGVFADVPQHSHMEFDMLLSLTTFPVSESTTWAAYSVYTYVVLEDEKFVKNVEGKIPALVEQYFGPQVMNILGKSYAEYVAAGNIHRYHLQPIEDIHLQSNYQYEIKPNSDIQYVYIFSIVGVFIIFIASVNFTNLSIARSLKRSKEIGVRKVHGSQRKQIITQFLLESAIITFLSTLLALVVIIVALPSFNDVTGKQIEISAFNFGIVVPLLLFFMTLLAFGAGFYPSLVLSAFEPLKVLKDSTFKGSRKLVLRNVLLIIQFGISALLIICTIVIKEQRNFLRDQNLGFAKDQLLVIERANILGAQREAFTNEIRELKGVEFASNTFAIPGRQYGGATLQVAESDATERVQFLYTFADYHYIPTLGVQLIAGRNFSEDNAGDSLSVIINESLLKALGWSESEAIGKKIRPVFDTANQYEIVGVVKNFNYQSLYSSVFPLVLFGNDRPQFNPTNMIVRFHRETSRAQLLSDLEKKWNIFSNGDTFEHSFVSDDTESQYGREDQFTTIFSLFSFLSILISIVGVIGLSSFIIGQKVKEIGIRKVLGASPGNLLVLLSKDFLILAVMANVACWPLAWYGLEKWLSQYPYRTEFNFLVLVLTVLITIGIVFCSIVFQSIRASLVNPVKSLRTE